MSASRRIRYELLAAFADAGLVVESTEAVKERHINMQVHNVVSNLLREDVIASRPIWHADTWRWVRVYNAEQLCAFFDDVHNQALEKDYMALAALFASALPLSHPLANEDSVSTVLRGVRAYWRGGDDAEDDPSV